MSVGTIDGVTLGTLDGTNDGDVIIASHCGCHCRHHLAELLQDEDDNGNDNQLTSESNKESIVLLLRSPPWHDLMLPVIHCCHCQCLLMFLSLLSSSCWFLIDDDSNDNNVLLSSWLTYIVVKGNHCDEVELVCL
jgi:hypothetical protein